MSWSLAPLTANDGVIHGSGRSTKSVARVKSDAVNATRNQTGVRIEKQWEKSETEVISKSVPFAASYLKRPLVARWSSVSCDRSR